MAGEKRKRGGGTARNVRQAAASNGGDAIEPAISSCSHEIPVSGTSAAPPASPATPTPLALVNEDSEGGVPSIDNIWKSVTKSVQKEMGFDFHHDDCPASKEADDETPKATEADFGDERKMIELISKKHSLLKHDVVQKTLAIHQLYQRFLDAEKDLSETRAELQKSQEESAKLKEELAKTVKPSTEADEELKKKVQVLSKQLTEKDAIIGLLNRVKDPQGAYKELYIKYNELKQKFKLSSP